MDYTILHNELTADSLARSYSTMTDAEAAADLNTAYRTYSLERLDQADVYNAVVVAEFIALGADARQEAWNIIHVGGATGLWVRPGDTARTRLISLFGAQSDTIQALAALLTESIHPGSRVGPGKSETGACNQSPGTVR